MNGRVKMPCPRATPTPPHACYAPQQTLPQKRRRETRDLLRGLAPGRRVEVVAADESLIRQVGVHVAQVLEVVYSKTK